MQKEFKPGDRVIYERKPCIILALTAAVEFNSGNYKHAELSELTHAPKWTPKQWEPVIYDGKPYRVVALDPNDKNGKNFHIFPDGEFKPAEISDLWVSLEQIQKS